MDFRHNGIMNHARLGFGGGGAPAYTPPSAPPPAAQPATLASSSVAAKSAQAQQRELGAAAYGGTVATSPEGVTGGVSTAKTTLGGVS